MSQDEAVPGTPPGLVSADPGDGTVALVVDATVHPLEAVYGAAYTFIDRFYVFIDRPDEEKFRVTLGAKDLTATDESQLRAMAGEFANELLACSWRQQLTKQNRAMIESVTMQAFAGAMGPPSLEELEDFDFTEEPFEDPLGIATSWEEKYKKKEPKAKEPNEGEPG